MVDTSGLIPQPRSWDVEAEERIAALEQMCLRHERDISDLYSRIEALEADRHPGK